MMPRRSAQLEQRERARTATSPSARAKLQRERAAFEAERKQAAEGGRRRSALAGPRAAQGRCPSCSSRSGFRSPGDHRSLLRPSRPRRCGTASHTRTRRSRSACGRSSRGDLGDGEEPAAEKLRELLGDNAAKLQQAEVKRVMSQPGRGQQTRATKPGKIPEAIRTPDQLRKFLREQDMAAERAARVGGELGRQVVAAWVLLRDRRAGLRPRARLRVARPRRAAFVSINVGPNRHARRVERRRSRVALARAKQMK